MEIYAIIDTEKPKSWVVLDAAGGVTIDTFDSMSDASTVASDLARKNLTKSYVVVELTATVEGAVAYGPGGGGLTWAKVEGDETT